MAKPLNSREQANRNNGNPPSRYLVIRMELELRTSKMQVVGVGLTPLSVYCSVYCASFRKEK